MFDKLKPTLPTLASVALVALAGLWTTGMTVGRADQQQAALSQRVTVLEQQQRDQPSRREMDDLKAWLSRIESKIDRLHEDLKH